MMELFKSEASLFLCSYIGQENVLGKKRENKAHPVGWLSAKATNSQFGLCAEAWRSVSE